MWLRRWTPAPTNSNQIASSTQVRRGRTHPFDLYLGYKCRPHFSRRLVVQQGRVSRPPRLLSPTILLLL